MIGCYPIGKTASAVRLAEAFLRAHTRKHSFNRSAALLCVALHRTSLPCPALIIAVSAEFISYRPASKAVLQLALYPEPDSRGPAAFTEAAGVAKPSP